MGKISAGAAKICITPPSEMMPAYFHGKMIFEGIYEDIYLRALVFDNGDRRMAFLSYESGDMARMEELRSAALIRRMCVSRQYIIMRLLPLPIHIKVLKTFRKNLTGL